MKNNLEIYCVTNKKLSFLENLNLKLAGVGQEHFNEKYITSKTGVNIHHKESYYSELTFHYWFWKNLLKTHNKDTWIGFCQKRRFWVREKIKDDEVNLSNFKNYLLREPDNSWKNYDAIICNKINLSKVKKMKLLKRSFRSIIKKPSLFFGKNKGTIKLHFDMHHGYGNLEKAISVMKSEHKDLFLEYVLKSKSYNPHIMFISKPYIIDKWFDDLFSWLDKCEKIFGFTDLKGYDTQRLYAFLAERYLSFWFKKNTRYLEWPWIFFDTTK